MGCCTRRRSPPNPLPNAQQNLIARTVRVRPQQWCVAALVQFAQPAWEDLVAWTQQSAAQDHKAIAVGIDGHLDILNFEVAGKERGGLRFEERGLATMVIVAFGVVSRRLGALRVKGNWCILREFTHKASL